jgi:hypothetical protein
MEIVKRADGRFELDFGLLGGPFVVLTEAQLRALESALDDYRDKR